MKIGNDKETSKFLYSTLFCHFKEPLYLLQLEKTSRDIALFCHFKEPLYLLQR